MKHITWKWIKKGLAWWSKQKTIKKKTAYTCIHPGFLCIHERGNVEKSDRKR